MYKPPDITLFGKSVEMKFKVPGKIQWFKGQITMYDGLTGKYGIYFPCDSETVYVYPNDKDLAKVYLITVIQCRHSSSHYIIYY